MPDISIIILSYNTKSITRKSITTLFATLSSQKNLDVEIIVFDNGSKDGSDEMLKKIQNSKFEIRNLKIILNKRNVGYAKGNNQAIKIAKAQYILFLNSDVLVENVDFRELLGYLNSHKDVAALTTRVVLSDGKIDPASHRGFPTPWNSFCYYLGLERLFGRVAGLSKLFGGYHLTHLNPTSIHEIDSPSGAFFLTRIDIVNRISGFDENFFMYGEDLDLSFRIKQLGYKIIYYPTFSVTHLKYTSGLKTANRKTRSNTKTYFYQAMRIFYRKHYEKTNAWVINKLIYLFIGFKEKFL